MKKKYFFFVLVLVFVVGLACTGFKSPTESESDLDPLADMIDGPMVDPNNIQIGILLDGKYGLSKALAEGDARVSTNMIWIVDNQGNSNRWINLPDGFKMNDEEWTYQFVTQTKDQNGRWIHNYNVVVGGDTLPDESVSGGIAHLKISLGTKKIFFPRISDGLVKVRFVVTNMPSDADSVKIMGTFTNTISHGWQRYLMWKEGTDWVFEMWISAGEKHQYNVVGYRDDLQVYWPLYDVFANNTETHTGEKNYSSKWMEFEVDMSGNVTLHGTQDWAPASSVDHVKFECRAFDKADSVTVGGTFNDWSYIRMNLIYGNWVVYLDNIETYTEHRYLVRVYTNGSSEPFYPARKCYVQSQETNRGYRWVNEATQETEFNMAIEIDQGKNVFLRGDTWFDNVGVDLGGGG